MAVVTTGAAYGFKRTQGEWLGTSVMVTGTATAVVHNANGMEGADLGPVRAVGAPFDCADEPTRGKRVTYRRFCIVLVKDKQLRYRYPVFGGRRRSTLA